MPGIIRSWMGKKKNEWRLKQSVPSDVDNIITNYFESMSLTEENAPIVRAAILVMQSEGMIDGMMSMRLVNHAALQRKLRRM